MQIYQPGVSEGAKENYVQNTSEIGRFEGLNVTVNPYAQEVYKPELYETDIEEGYEVDWDNVKVPTASILDAQERGLLNSEEDMRRLEARYKHMSDAYSLNATYNPISNAIFSMPAIMLDPTNAPELALASVLGPMSLGARFTVGATANAATNYASETILQKRTGYVDHELKEMAALTGFFFGGTIYSAFGKRLADPIAVHTPGAGTSDALEGVHHRTAEGDVKVWVKDEDNPGQYKLNPADEDVVERGNRFAWGMLGRLYASASTVTRKIAQSLDVAGTSAGKNTRDTAQYLKDKIMSLHFETVNKLNGLHTTDGKGLSASEWNKELTRQHARKVNGKIVPPEWKEAVDVFHNWAEAQGKHLEEAGYGKQSDWTARQYNIDEIIAVGETQFKKDFAAAILSKKVSQATNKLNLRKDTLDKKINRINAKIEALPKGEKLKSKKALRLRAQRKTAVKERANVNAKLKRKADVKHIRDAENEAQSMWDSFAKDPDGRSDVSSLQKRSRQVDESMISRYLHQDAANIIMHTANRTAGRLATAKALGISNEDGLVKTVAAFKEELRKEGVLSEREMAKMSRYYEKSIKDIWGTLMIPSNPNGYGNLVKRFLMNSNFATMGGGMVITAIQGEIAVIVAANSIKSAIKGLGYGTREFKNIFKSQPMSSEYVRKLQIMSHAFDVLNHSAIGRYIDADFIHKSKPNMNWMDKATVFSERAAEQVAHKTGLTSVTANFRIAIAHSILDDLFFSPIKKLSKAGDLRKYERLQFDTSRIKELQSYADKVFKYDKEGRIKDIDLTKLPTDLQHQLDRAISNASRLNILTGDKKHLPSFMSDADNPVIALMFQFMAFPMQSWDSLLLRGMTENKAKLTVGAATGIMATTMFSLAKDEMNYRMGWTDERKYDVSTNEGIQALGLRAFKMGSYTASLGVAGDWLSQAITGKNLGSDYRNPYFLSGVAGPTGSRLADLFKILQKADFNPLDGNSNAWTTAHGRAIMLNSFLPLYSLPIVGDGLRALNRDLASNVN